MADQPAPETGPPASIDDLLTDEDREELRRDLVAIHNAMHPCWEAR